MDIKGFSCSSADLQKVLERVRSPPAAQCKDGKGCETAWSSQAGCSCCPWLFSEDSRCCSEAKEEKEVHRSQVSELSQVHRHVRVTLISSSLRGMENIQPSTKFSLFADLFYLLRVSHSSGV